MSIKNRNMFTLFAAAILAFGVTTSAVYAEDEEHEHEGHSIKAGSGGVEKPGRPLQPAKTDAKFQQECSTCHVAYAPGLLPAESWRKLMSGLDKHFGTNAAVDAQDNKEITDFLVKNASNRWTANTAPLRISEATWFKREHNEREINPALWKNPKVKSVANCGACHTQADKGDYSEHRIKMPK
jgi:mono/diheme cytochrome c family protein